jgi:Domain of unknown function (DUF6984)
MPEKSDFREASLEERLLLQGLLEVDFAGKREVAAQLNASRVRTLDPEGSLELDPGTHFEKAPVDKRIPVEAEGIDEDGITIHVLLHVVDGVVKELEIYKDNGSPIRRLPNSCDLKLLVLPGPA